MRPAISLQLWSIQDACAEDFFGTLKKVKEFGYDAVEFAGYYDVPAVELKNYLAELGLEISGSHLGIERFTEELEATLAYETALGSQNLIIPWYQGADLAEWRSFFKQIASVLPAVNAAGFTLGYHNHAHEFTQITDVNLMEAMLAAVPEIKFEVDTYWVSHAGLDVVPWLQAQGDAIKWLHIKDMLVDGEHRESTELGQGTLPLVDYVTYAKEQGIQWLVVEQEAFQKYSPLESAALNFTALNKIVNEVYKHD